MKKKILVVLLCLIFLYCIGGVIYSVLVKQNESTDETSSSLLTINNYDYSLSEERVSSLYKNEFTALKNNLESDEVNIDEYVRSIAKLYIIDLYSLKDKTNKYDVTASQYVKEESKENFKLKVSETIYKYIEDNTNNTRNQELPQVSEVVVNSVENIIYLIDTTEYEAYKVNVEWLYEKDLGYDTSANLILININNKISVVEENRVETLDQSGEIEEIKNS